MRLLISFCALIFSGCGATGKFYNELSALEKGGQAEVVIFRKSQLTGAAACLIAKIDGKEIGLLGNGGFLRALVTPGRNSISMINPYGLSPITIDLSTTGDRSTFVEHLSSVSHGMIVPFTSVSFSRSMIEVSSEYALKTLQDLRDSSLKPSCMAVAAGEETSPWPR